MFMGLEPRPCVQSGLLVRLFICLQKATIFRVSRTPSGNHCDQWQLLLCF